MEITWNNQILAILQSFVLCKTCVFFPKSIFAMRWIHFQGPRYCSDPANRAAFEAIGASGKALKQKCKAGRWENPGKQTITSPQLDCFFGFSMVNFLDSKGRLGVPSTFKSSWTFFPPWPRRKKGRAGSRRHGDQQTAWVTVQTAIHCILSVGLCWFTWRSVNKTFNAASKTS